MPYYDILSLRGALDDTSPPSILEEDRCTVAENVEFVDSTCGERRRGCTAIDLPSSITGNANLDAVTWAHRHLGSNLEGASELWLFAQSLTGADNLLTRRTKTTWETITPLVAIDSEEGRGHQISAQTLHGKLFFSYKSAEDRTYVYDGTTLRRAGHAAPGAAPTVADTGSGSFTGTRYYRVRFTTQASGTTIIRSEPSAVQTFSPSGSGTDARITKPASIGEDETHWEVEASLDNVNFYRIATVVVGTTTYDDSTAFTTGYAASGTLSEDIQDYTLLPSGKFLRADQDRLLVIGSWESTDQASRVRWTPVFAASGVGNDERLELDTDPFLDLDGFEGGEITDVGRTLNGYIHVYKRGHVYRLVRTGNRAQAYEAFALTKSRGALPGSVITAVDQAGLPAEYFLDPSVGPMRIGPSGLQWCGRDIQTRWDTVNTNATVPCHGVYQRETRQVHYWVATGSSEYPNEKIIVHTNEMRDSEEGARRGWVTVPDGDRIAAAHCSVMFSPNVDTTDDRTFPLVPFIGKEAWTVGLNSIRDLVQRCNTGNTDAHTDGDTVSTYYARVKTRPFTLSGLLTHLRLMSAALLVKTSTDADARLSVHAIRDFGAEDLPVATDLLAAQGEEFTIKRLDDLNFSEIHILQLEMGDLNTDLTPPEAWQINQVQIKVNLGQEA